MFPLSPTFFFLSKYELILLSYLLHIRAARGFGSPLSATQAPVMADPQVADLTSNFLSVLSAATGS